MGKAIEKFLGLNEAEINIRKEELKRTLPSIPGTKYLEQRLKEFKVQPWPFIDYLVHYAPKELNSLLESYYDYDAGENVQGIMEKLREQYIMFELLQDLEKTI